jgi:hypothetical protein
MYPSGTGNATAAQLAQAWENAGGATDTQTWTTAVAIALAEQGGDAYGINYDVDGYSAGAWQIHDVNWPSLESAGIITQPIDLTNLVTNANAAIYMSGNGKNWTPWSTWWGNANLRIGPGKGTFQSHWADAQAGVAAVQANGNPAPGNGSQGVLNEPQPGPNGLVNEAEAAIGAVWKDVTGAVQFASGWQAQLAALIADVDGAFQSFGNVIANFGVFNIALVLVLFGGLMIALSWGEDIAKSIEKVASNPAVQNAVKTGAEAA